MKQLLTLLLATAIATTQAQVQNGGFEDLNSNVLPSYWQGNLVLLSVWVDSTGVFHADSVVFDGGSNYLLNTTDVHSGVNAVELRNGFNYTAGTPIPGTWTASSDSAAYNGFPLVFVETLQRPGALRFFSKFLPIGGDSAWAGITLYDAAMNEIGHGEQWITGTFNTYTLFDVPINYSTADSAAFMSLSFSTAGMSGNATLGSRLLIDDVSLVASTVGIDDVGAPLVDMVLYPNPVQETFSLRTADRSIGDVRVVDLAGRPAPITRNANGSFNCSQLANGLYVLSVRTQEGEGRVRFAVER